MFSLLKNESMGETLRSTYRENPDLLALTRRSIFDALYSNWNNVDGLEGGPVDEAEKSTAS